MELEGFGWRSDDERRADRRAYARDRARGILRPRVIIPLEKRVLAKLDRVYGDVPEHRPELGPCWPWMGALNSDGYGVIKGDVEPGKRQPLLLVHRVTLSLALGRPIREGMYSNHHCDNTRCGRPRHLYEGTHQQNVDDMNERGRAVKPPIKRKRVG